jgi:hypothetical protein
MKFTAANFTCKGRVRILDLCLVFWVMMACSLVDMVTVSQELIVTIALGGLVFSVVASGPKVRGSKPVRGRWIFNGDNYPYHDFRRRGSKAVRPMS